MGAGLVEHLCLTPPRQHGVQLVPPALQLFPQHLRQESYRPRGMPLQAVMAPDPAPRRVITAAGIPQVGRAGRDELADDIECHLRPVVPWSAEAKRASHTGTSGALNGMTSHSAASSAARA